MPTLHIANKNYSSWSLRPWVLMKTLRLPFEEEMHFFSGGSNHADYRKFSPTGRVPCLVDGDVTVWDSLAITEYLYETDSRVWPADRVTRAWARAVAAEMHSGFSTLRNICSMSCGVRVALHAVPEGLAADVARIDEIWSEGLSRFGGPYLTGAEFTAADAFFCPVAFRVQSYGLGLSPAAAVYVETLLALPAMAEWYEAALAETERDAGHEVETGSHGVITADLRRR